MPIALYRIDDRLIHGQVVVGWGEHLDLDFIAVVDDELAESEWEQDLYRAGLPEALEARFVSVDQAERALGEWQESTDRGIVLTRDVATMRRLAERGALDGRRINLGGLHESPGRRRVLPYLYLSDGDRAELRKLETAGLEVSARDVPGGREVELDELLDTSSR